MKKRTMKKYIPKNTNYCYSKLKFNEICKNLRFKGFETVFYSCDGKKEKTFKIPTYKCRYTGTVPTDVCKDCGISYSNF